MDKRLFFGLFLAVSAVSFFILPSFAQETSIAEKIISFDVTADVLEDGSVDVKEEIVYDFGSNQRHGIYRDIDTEGIEIKVKAVLQPNGQPTQHQISREKSYLRVKIGNPDEFVAGRQSYQIFYQVRSALGYFDDYDELYWDVTGNRWPVPVETASIIISLPQPVRRSDYKLTCYTGPYQSAAGKCQFQVVGEGQIRFQTTRPLGAGEGLTIVLGWPKGIVSGPSSFEKFFSFLKKWGVFLLPLFIFVFLFQRWWQHGRDIKVKKTVIAQYEPPDNLKPAETALLLRQRVRPQDISATIIDLAVRGYLKIKEEQKKQFIFKTKDWRLIKLKDFSGDANLADYEKHLLSKIFKKGDEQLISSMKQRGWVT